jgi:large repetitive protein
MRLNSPATNELMKITTPTRIPMVLASFKRLGSLSTALAAALLAWPPPAAQAAAQAKAADEVVEGELLVGFKRGTARGGTDVVREGLGAAKIQTWPEINAEHWHVPAGLSVAQAIQALEANPNVLYAEPNYIVHAAENPNDPLFNQQWGQHNIAQTGGTFDADIDGLEAMQVPPGSAPVIVGVVDSGIDYNHEDLADRIWVNLNEVPGNGVDDDHNGYIDDIRGWDFYFNDNDPTDDDGHGTHVSGIIAAGGNNGVGVIGVAGLNSKVKLMPLKFLGPTGSGSLSAAVSAILYAASFKDASGAKVVRITNHSWSGPKLKTLDNAINTCGALVVAAAGNDGSSTMVYPAGYPHGNIVVD